MEAQYYSDFKFGDKSLSDFGGVIKNADGWQIKSGVTTTKITESIPNRHGEILIHSKYNPRLIPVSIFINEDIDIDEFYGWLLSGEQTFSYVDSGREIQAILDNEIDIRAYYDGNFQGLLDLSFIAYDPFWTVTNEKHIVNNSVVLNTPIVIKGKGNIESFPLIKITSTIPHGYDFNVVKFKWNDMIINLFDAPTEVYINCEQEECYKMELGQKVASNFSSTEYYEYPSIQVGKNTFELIEGNITNLDILPNTRFI